MSVTGLRHRQAAKPSILAMGLSLALVAGAVLFGIYGPEIAQRSSMSGGVPLGELLSAALDYRTQMLLGALHDASSLQGQQARMEESIRNAFGPRIPLRALLPDLSAERFKLLDIQAVSLPGIPHGAFALCYRSETDGELLVLFVMPDQGQFIAFDSVGRPMPLMPERIYREDISRGNGDESEAVVWSDGPVLRIGVAESDATIVKLRSALGMP